MTDDPRDADPALTHLVRAGDERAVSELYERHHPAVLAFARRLCQDPHTAEDLASEAFARTLRTVRNGSGGPSGGWRPYLYAVARNTAIEWARSQQRLVLTDEFREDELTTAPPEPPDDLVTRAYRSLPPRWQTVLWHTLIEEEDPERVAKILGVTPGNVGVLAFRAREGLRKAYLAAHVAGASPRCLQYAEPLAAIVRKRSERLPRALRAHLSTCATCARAHAELLDLNATLRAAVPVALLPLAMKAASDGGVGSGAVASEGAVAGKGGALFPGGWGAGVGDSGGGGGGGGRGGRGRGDGGSRAGAAGCRAHGEPAAGREPAVHSGRRTGAGTDAGADAEADGHGHAQGGGHADGGPGADVRADPRRPASAGTPTRRTTPSATAQAGTRLALAGRCVGAAGGEVAALPCADPRTAWRTRGSAQRFQLVNVVTGRCLAAGEQYDTTAFNGGGMLAVRLVPCASVPAQHWHRPAFSDGVRRLVSVPSGKALSVGKEFVGKSPPTAFILYGPYTGSADQRVTFANG